MNRCVESQLADHLNPTEVPRWDPNRSG